MTHFFYYSWEKHTVYHKSSCSIHIHYLSLADVSVKLDLTLSLSHWLGRFLTTWKQKWQWTLFLVRYFSICPANQSGWFLLFSRKKNTESGDCLSLLPHIQESESMFLNIKSQGKRARRKNEKKVKKTWMWWLGTVEHVREVRQTRSRNGEGGRKMEGNRSGMWNAKGTKN